MPRDPGVNSPPRRYHRRLTAGSKHLGLRRGRAVGRGAVKLAMGERKLDYNPFAEVVPRSRDTLLRRWVPLTDGDMDLVRSNLGRLRTEDQLLWHLLART